MSYHLHLRHSIFLLLFAGLVSSGVAFAHSTTPVALREGISIRRLLDAEQSALLLARDPATGQLYYLNGEGALYRVLFHPDGAASSELVYTAADHGMTYTAGITFANDGTIFLLGNFPNGKYTVLRIRRGVPKSDGSGARAWSTVAESEPYPLAGQYDHLFNAIVVSPDQKHLFIQAGSRGNHGEEESNGGTFPGLRGVPLSSVILRLPIDADSIRLLNDETALRSAGYYYAAGFRNTYSLAFAPDGELFGVENSGDRDDSEEMNWIREGHHYGFPWRIGTNDNPQQFPGYDPETDPLVNKKFGAYIRGLFRDDPGFPAPPAGVTFTDPIPNIGPDADKFRDPITGEVRDGSELGRPVGTFTAHRSPLGLVFDTDMALGELRGDAFCLSWTKGDANSDTLDGPFFDASQDLLHLELLKTDTSYMVRSTKMIEGFNFPVAAALTRDTMYVLESGGNHTLWEIILPKTSSVGEYAPEQIALQHYPNPVGETATITFYLETASVVSLSLADPLGRTRSLLGSTVLGTGSHAVQLDAATLAAGVYYYTLAVGSRVYVRPLVIVK
jgi:glucose/arabinose dehydrogenase